MKTYLSVKIREALEISQRQGILPDFELPLFQVNRPEEVAFGEYTTNIALMTAKLTKQSSQAFAEVLKETLLKNDSRERFFEKIEVAGPGHLNFFLSQKVLGQTVEDIIAQGNAYGDSLLGQGQAVNNEFISANPTGPLHLGNGRGGFFGDTLSRVLRKTGYAVTNEYYVNDAGEQVVKLGHSVLKDNEAVYAGEYIDALHQEFMANDVQATDARVIGEQAALSILQHDIQPTLVENMGIIFDTFTSEKHEIIEQGYVDKALSLLREKNLTYESESAVWLKTKKFGDDKDRVLVKSDGTRTYFASDCGYLLFKMERGFARFVLTLGADHHGYQARLRAAAEALGFVGHFDFVFVQMVRLMKDGEEVRMSKRAGNVVSIDELIEKIGVDVARFFFLMYSPDTHMNFDLGLAEERSQKNPVYYAQYAYARLSSIVRKAEAEGFDANRGDVSLLTHPKERILLAELLAFPDLIKETSENYSVHHLPQYAIRLADHFHSFYGACRVIDENARELSEARLRLVNGVIIVLKETLRLIGVSAPESM
ncbi:MAG: arginine--tRNA ligase [Candidatus Moranbacteria bacterium]|nr:arginine--tRNA ligase [Candidatus Moranbacteria bacterium]MBP9801385.1 arginine--tRNA ligase [Candidatus Moranbacteria bacterium]